VTLTTHLQLLQASRTQGSIHRPIISQLLQASRTQGSIYRPLISNCCRCQEHKDPYTDHSSPTAARVKNTRIHIPTNHLQLLQASRTQGSIYRPLISQLLQASRTQGSIYPLPQSSCHTAAITLLPTIYTQKKEFSKQGKTMKFRHRKLNIFLELCIEQIKKSYKGMYSHNDQPTTTTYFLQGQL
jgi:hypothetical protein